MELLTTNHSLPAEISTLSLLFTDDQEVRALNSGYRNLNKTTDVLSFSMLECDRQFKACQDLGDIVISVPQALLQAKRFKVSLSEEILRLLIHGILHLFGYEHVAVSKSRAVQMRNMEKVLMQKYRSLVK